MGAASGTERALHRALHRALIGHCSSLRKRALLTALNSLAFNERRADWQLGSTTSSRQCTLTGDFLQPCSSGRPSYCFWTHSLAQDTLQLRLGRCEVKLAHDQLSSSAGHKGTPSSRRGPGSKLAAQEATPLNCRTVMPRVQGPPLPVARRAEEEPRLRARPLPLDALVGSPDLAQKCAHSGASQNN